jgi:hypothetical protein
MRRLFPFFGCARFQGRALPCRSPAPLPSRCPGAPIRCSGEPPTLFERSLLTVRAELVDVPSVRPLRRAFSPEVVEGSGVNARLRLVVASAHLLLSVQAELVEASAYLRPSPFGLSLSKPARAPPLSVQADPSTSSGVNARLRLVEALMEDSLGLEDRAGIPARQPGNFLLLRQKKVTKEKATRLRRPRGTGAALRCSAKPGNAETRPAGSNICISFSGLACAARRRRRGPQERTPAFVSLRIASMGRPLALPLGPVCGVEQRRAGREKKCRCLSPYSGEFLHFPPRPSSAEQSRYSGTAAVGSPFFGDFLWRSKESHPAAGPESRRGLPSQGCPPPGLRQAQPERRGVTRAGFDKLSPNGWEWHALASTGSA